MPDATLDEGTAKGVGKHSFHSATVNLSNSGTYDTGLASVNQAVADASGGNANVANVSGVSGGTVTVELVDDGGVAVSAAEDIDIIAIGVPN